MDLVQTLEDIEDIAETLQDDETDAWIDYDEEDIEDEDYDEEEAEEKDKFEAVEEQKDVEAKSKEIIHGIDIFANFMTEFEAKRMKELATKDEKEEKQLRQLIRVERKKDDVSEETLITPEEEDIVSDRVSTESSVYLCLREIDISDSQLKLNPYTVYQVPNDPGLLPAFWLLREHPPIYSTDGVQKFYDMVKRMGLRPIGSMKDMLLTDYLNLRYYGFATPAIKVICDALADNSFVRKVDLKDNKLSPNACRHLNDLLLKNKAITDLSLSGCQIGTNGAKELYDAISKNETLKTLDLSSCNLENEGFGYVASALSDNQDLESVNLSNNHLDEMCSENLRNLLSHSKGLTHLDLSWNSLYNKKVWKALFDGLKKNKMLRSLNLSWNALEKECFPQLYQILTRLQNIEKLDLSWNRFTEDSAEIIGEALLKNSTLQELHLGNNPLKAQGVLNLVHAITPQLSPNSAVRLLDLENVWANKDVLHNLELIEKLRPWVVVKLGGILSNYPLVGPHVRRILLKRANYEAMRPKRKRQRRNFGHFVMSLKDKKISRAKFKTLVQKFKLKLSKSLVEEIMNAFEGPNDTVDQEQLKLFYLEEYPETMAALLKLKFKKKES